MLMEGLSLRQKETSDLVRRVRNARELFKRWFYYVGIKFLQTKQLTDDQETFLEEVTDFFMSNLENIENDRSFLKKVTLDPIVLPKPKVKKKH